MNATALIAEDEALLAADLQAQLARLWPELSVVAAVSDGAAAVERALALKPAVLFLDIRMPGMSGLEAAQALAEDWPLAGEDAQPFPLLVFVTAYDQYALQAFEHCAVDYLLKPVQPERLAQTCARLQTLLRQRDASRSDAAPALESALGQLRGLLSAPGLVSLHATAPQHKLAVIQAGVGSAVHMVPVAEVLYFEAADKYVRVVTTQRDYLIRTSLRELIPQLDEQVFWQVHRAIVVRAEAIATAVRDESGKVLLTLRGSKDKLTASRLYAPLFKPM
jgi:DNA-binding LytR/AlgR family response regulator